MWWNLVLLTSFFWNFDNLAAQSLTVDTTKLFTRATSNDSSRISYTGLTQDSVFENYNPVGYNVQLQVDFKMLVRLPSNCSCPDLRPIRSVATANGLLKLQRAEMITSDMVDHGLAGYIAPFSGYCSSNNTPLIEYYSEILNEFRYDTSISVNSYHTNYQSQFRPVRVLGYGYLSFPSIMMSGTPPFVHAGYTHKVYKTISVRFDLIQELTKNNIVSYVGSPQLIKKLVTEEGWIITGGKYATVSRKNELDKIREICGGDVLQRCRDTFDPSTGVYRPINLDRNPLRNGTIVGDCGYFMATNTCFRSLDKIHSDIESVGTISRAQFGVAASWTTEENFAGFASWSIFELLKL